MKLPSLLLVLALISPVAMADNHKAEKPSFAASRTLTFSAEVLAVNQETREVSLRNQDGEEFTLTASPEVRNLAQVEVGDEVLGELTEEVSVSVHANPEGLEPSVAQTALGARAEEGSMPGGVLADEVMITAIVESIDLENNTFKLRGPAGQIHEFEARDPNNLLRSAVGDLLVIRITQAVGVVVERPMAAAE